MILFCQWSYLEHSGALVHEPQVRVGQPHRVWLLEAVIFGTGLEAVEKNTIFSLKEISNFQGMGTSALEPLISVKAN